MEQVGLPRPSRGVSGLGARVRAHSRERRPLRLFLGHHKCASCWASDILLDLCATLRWCYWSIDHPGPFAPVGLSQWATDNRIDVVGFLNARPELLPDDPNMRGFHLIRDPRDLCVSAYWSHRNSHSIGAWPELELVRSHLNALPFDEGLAFEIEFLGGVMHSLANWDYSDPRIIEARLEELAPRAEVEFVRISSFLGLSDSAVRTSRGRRPATRRVIEPLRRRAGLPRSRHVLDPASVRRIVARHDFSVKSGGRARGLVDVGSHYRDGTPGAWRAAFTPEHHSLFASLYPTLLETLGYEASQSEARTTPA